MKLYSLKIKDSVFKVSVISDEKDMVEGLSGKPKLGEGKGLFFKFEEPQEVTMNMGGMLHPIDMIFIGKDFKVIGVEKMNIGSSPITVDKVHYVIEVNKGEGKDLKGEKMQMSRPLAEELGFKVTDILGNIYESSNAYAFGVIYLTSDVSEGEELVFSLARPSSAPGGDPFLISKDVSLDDAENRIIDNLKQLLNDKVDTPFPNPELERVRLIIKDRSDYYHNLAKRNNNMGKSFVKKIKQQRKRQQPQQQH